MRAAPWRDYAAIAVFSGRSQTPRTLRHISQEAYVQAYSTYEEKRNQNEAENTANAYNMADSDRLKVTREMKRLQKLDPAVMATDCGNLKARSP